MIMSAGILAFAQAQAPAIAPLEHLASPDNQLVWFLATVVKMLAIFTIYMVGVMMVIWAERRICAFIQDRRGPNRVGPYGLLQSVADGVKNIMKEETYPGQAYIPLFILAPAMSFTAALLTWAVVPFAAPFNPGNGMLLLSAPSSVPALNPEPSASGTTAEVPTYSM